VMFARRHLAKKSQDLCYKSLSPANASSVKLVLW
jgi:hypothetical protein